MTDNQLEHQMMWEESGGAAPGIREHRTGASTAAEPVYSINPDAPCSGPEGKEEQRDLDRLLSSYYNRITRTGTIVGVEQESSASLARAVVQYGSFKVIIPASEISRPDPDRKPGVSEVSALNHQLSLRLGAEIDFLVEGFQPDYSLFAASRLKAMEEKMLHYYGRTGPDGTYVLREGSLAEARVVAVVRTGILAEVFGAETRIGNRELSFREIRSPGDLVQVGDTLAVKLLQVDRTDPKNVQIQASARAAQQRQLERAFRSVVPDGLYTGRVSGISKQGEVFVALDLGLSVKCPMPTRWQVRRDSRCKVRIRRIDQEHLRLSGYILQVLG